MQEKDQITDTNAEQEMNEANLAAEPETMEATELESADNTALVELQKQLDEAKSKYLYLAADFENFKRNTARERMDLIQSAGREIITTMLPILDDFERAQKNGGLSDGMTLIQQKLANAMRGKGLNKLEINIGDTFNPEQQEAVAEIPAPSEELKGKIIDILEPGYQLGERIIRYAKVVTGK